MGYRDMGAICQIDNQKSKSYRVALTLPQFYRFVDSVKRARNKGKSTTMWIDEGFHSSSKFYSKTMWIEDSVIGKNNESKYQTNYKYNKLKKR
jgi:hypothetical protein